MKTKQLLLALLTLGILGCSDVTSPFQTEEKTSVITQMIEPIQVYQNPSFEEKKDTTKKKDVGNKKESTKKRALPLPCLRLSSEQMELFNKMQRVTEQKNSLLRKEFEIKVKSLKDSLLKGQKSTLNKDSINNLIIELKGKIKDIELQQSQLEKEFKLKNDSIINYYKTQMKSAGDNKELIQKLELKMKEELKNLQSKYTEQKTKLNNRKLELTKQITTLQNSLKETNPNSELKSKIEELIKKMELELKSKMEQNEREFLVLFRTILTPEQQTIWDNWLKGKDCDRKVEKKVN